MPEHTLKNKIIVLGVSGGIAAYKAADLASKLTQAGATVKTVMTKNAANFVGPLTFQSVTGQAVVTDLFALDANSPIQHVSLGEEADVILVAPATANIIAKAAYGIADDALSTTLLAAQSPVIMVPAMNNHMWNNPATQDNIATIKKRGIHVLEPEVGRLACGSEQEIGRFPKIEAITEYLAGLFTVLAGLSGRTILVTAGGTHEPIDAVRFIGNRSSGKMGYAIAAAAQARGAKVILISAHTCLQAPAGVELINVETALEMREAVLENLKTADALIMAAAVADFRASQPSDGKVKKDKMGASLLLEPNPDILQDVAAEKDRQVIIGFAAESENIIDYAVSKLKKKRLDLIVANDIGRDDAGFGSDMNLAVLVDGTGPLGDLTMYRKADLAGQIIDWLDRALSGASRT